MMLENDQPGKKIVESNQFVDEKVIETLSH